MSLHHAIITLKPDHRESGGIKQLIARVHQLTHETKMRCSDMGLHVEEIDNISLRIYGTTQQISELFESLLENNNIGALRIYPLEKISYAETGLGD